MGPLEKITGFELDKGNEQKNAKHGVTPAEAEQVFLNEPLVVLDDQKHSNAEQRFHALGQTSEGRLLHRKERTIYEQEA
jgi:uncharacterized DUF497 family protein